jgi:hypothetical protein
MEQNYGWIEIPIFAAIALGFGFYQLWSINREIARDRAAKAAQEQGGPNSGLGARHPEGQHDLDER